MQGETRTTQNLSRKPTFQGEEKEELGKKVMKEKEKPDARRVEIQKPSSEKGLKKERKVNNVTG